MQSMRYLNMFSKVCRVQTKYCFNYNNSLVFIVPNSKVTMAIGPGAKNAKMLSSKLGHKIKIIGIGPQPTRDGLMKFISTLADQTTINKLDFKDSEVSITGGRQTKASLIGRNRIREKELLNILNGVFGIKTIKFN